MTEVNWLTQNKDFFLILFAILAGWYTIFNDLQKQGKEFRKEFNAQNREFNEKLYKLELETKIAFNELKYEIRELSNKLSK